MGNTMAPLDILVIHNANKVTALIERFLFFSHDVATKDFTQ